MQRKKNIRIGLVGTGFIARGFSHFIQNDNELLITKVLTRRNPDAVDGLAIDKSIITNSIPELVKNSDIVVECTGDPVYATDVLLTVLEAGVPVVTMDSELHVTTGSWLAKKGTITEAEGDQPGSMANLLQDVLAMGFEPLVLGNIKYYLNKDPVEKEMKYWSHKHSISMDKVIAFTDGTKLQIEQALVANGLGAEILQQGMTGPVNYNYKDGATILAEIAERSGNVISDYVLSPNSPPGVFIAAKHNSNQSPYLKYYKMGDGPYYILTRPYHLCHLEMSKTVKSLANGNPILLNNSVKPKISVATISKKKLEPGEKINKGIGSFSVRGEVLNISDSKDHLPIGLAYNAVIRKTVYPGQVITFDDVDIPESKAVHVWNEIIDNVR